jgi:hypothetical protein
VSLPGLGALPGSTIFASNSQRNIPVDSNNFAPRVGFAYQVSNQTVVRGGFGVYYGMNVATNFQYPGTAFSSTPAVFFTEDNYVNRYATLENPFPIGIQDPQGTKYGKLAEWGLSNGNNLGLRESTQRRNLPVEPRVAASVPLADRGRHRLLRQSQHASALGRLQQHQQSQFHPLRLAPANYQRSVERTVTNPFQALFNGPGAIFNEPESRYGDDQIPQINLLRPYPQFNGSFQGLPLLEASSWYNSLQVRFQKRANEYLSFEGNYTWAKAEDNSSTGFNAFVGNLDSGNPQELDNLKAEWSVSANDATNRFAAAIVAQLPFGRGRLVGSGMSRWADTIIGGWQGSTTFTFQTGQPMPISIANPRLADGNQRPDVACAQVLTGISVHRAAFTNQSFLNAECLLMRAISRSATRLATSPTSALMASTISMSPSPKTSPWFTRISLNCKQISSTSPTRRALPFRPLPTRIRPSES